jgi:hypothetical protein
LRIARAIKVAAFAAPILFGACVPLGDETVGLCPTTAILEEPGQLIRFKTAPSNGPNDVLFQTKMVRISGVCDFNDKEIDMELEVAMQALRGPANKKGRAQFVYFVAILDRDKNVLNRVEFPMIAEFLKQDTEINFTEAVTVTIPRKKGLMPADYLIYLGFEMTPEELAFNRRRLRHR